MGSAMPSSAIEAMTEEPPAGDGMMDPEGIAQLVLDHLGYGIVSCDRRMVVLGCTQRAARLLEAPGRPLVGRTLPAWLERSLHEAVRKGQPVRIEPPRAKHAAYLSAMAVEAMAPVVFVVWFRPEIMRESDAEKVLRARYQLTARDARVLLHLRRGHSNRQISTRTGWTEATVKSYVHDLCEKLGVHTRGAAAALIDEIRDHEK
jgi:DNA-binding CsgD family transcriptional regulator